MITTELERSSALVSKNHLEHPRQIFRTNVNVCSGAFGEVRMCVHRESTAQRAVKVLRKSHMDEDEKRMLFNEINILKEIVSNHSYSSEESELDPFLAEPSGARNTPNTII